ncbi:MAG: hypothetical protein CL587_07915 [Alteromonadaceae bacterium]|nr:hypothetical protein [Alteromonadaceae bacterium]
METLRGIVNNVRFSTEVSGSASTSHAAVFKIGKRPVELKLSENIILENGDEVLLAGKVKKGLFKALAYNNLTSNVSGKGDVTPCMLMGVLFTVAGLATITSGIGLIFTPAGIYMIWYSQQLLKAYKIVTSELKLELRK